jgi:hypothetical protein
LLRLHSAQEDPCRRGERAGDASVVFELAMQCEILLALCYRFFTLALSRQQPAHIAERPCGMRGGAEALEKLQTFLVQMKSPVILPLRLCNDAQRIKANSRKILISRLS